MNKDLQLASMRNMMKKIKKLLFISISCIILQFNFVKYCISQNIYEEANMIHFLGQNIVNTLGKNANVLTSAMFNSPSFHEFYKTWFFSRNILVPFHKMHNLQFPNYYIDNFKFFSLVSTTFTMKDDFLSKILGSKTKFNTSFLGTKKDVCACLGLSYYGQTFDFLLYAIYSLRQHDYQITKFWNSQHVNAIQYSFSQYHEKNIVYSFLGKHIKYLGPLKSTQAFLDLVKYYEPKIEKTELTTFIEANFFPKLFQNNILCSCACHWGTHHFTYCNTHDINKSWYDLHNTTRIKQLQRISSQSFFIGFNMSSGYRFRFCNNNLNIDTLICAQAISDFEHLFQLEETKLRSDEEYNDILRYNEQFISKQSRHTERAFLQLIPEITLHYKCFNQEHINIDLISSFNMLFNIFNTSYWKEHIKKNIFNENLGIFSESILKYLSTNIAISYNYQEIFTLCFGSNYLYGNTFSQHNFSYFCIFDIVF